MLSIPQTRSFIRHFGRRSITSSHNLISNREPKLPKPLKQPVRGGQNLSERFKWLENSLRRKDATTRELATKSSQIETGHLARIVVSPATSPTATSSAQTHIFHGFYVPQEPSPPTDDECCMSGCAVCVYDLYEESMAAYKDEVDALRRSLAAIKIPEAEWPVHVRVQKPNAANLEAVHRKEKILSAFEEMERGLALKRQRQIEKDRS